MDNFAANRVLLIDDDADVASVVLAILTDEGYAVSILQDTSHDADPGGRGQAGAGLRPPGR